MTTLTLITILISLSITTLTCTNPFSIAIIILIVALITASIYASLHSSWLGFLLFLIYVGGILVIFSYFLAITPNQYQYNLNLIKIPTLSIFLLLIISILITDSWTPYVPDFLSLTKIIFTFQNMPILIILVLILLFSIIVVIKTCKLEKGPLRSFIRLYV